MSLTDRLDALQQRYPALGLPLAVIYKYVDDQGSYLAALIAYYVLVSLFPLLLLLSTVLSWVLTGHPELRAHVEHSALSEFPVIGPQLGRPRQLSGGAVGILVGVMVAHQWISFGTVLTAPGWMAGAPRHRPPHCGAANARLTRLNSDREPSALALRIQTVTPAAVATDRIGQTPPATGATTGCLTMQSPSPIV